VNIKLRCVLLDDEIPGLTYLKMLCEQLPQLEVVKAFNSPQKFLSELQNIDFDLCILDIEMPEVNGLQVAELLKGKFLIFTTAYKEFAAEAFDLDAIDYVRKPVQKDRLKQAIDKVVERQAAKKPASDFIQLNTDKGKTLIYVNQLAYIKTSDSDARDKLAVLRDGSSMTLKNISFENLSKLLPPKQFCRINKKEMVSIQIVVSYSYSEITTSMMNNGKQISLQLSEVFRPEFLTLANPDS
jgi:DNA-binding LytR/AlgR family response regulator